MGFQLTFPQLVKGFFEPSTRVFSENGGFVWWWFTMVESVKNHQKIKSKKYKFQKEKKGLYTGTGYSPCKWQKMAYKWGLLTTC